MSAAIVVYAWPMCGSGSRSRSVLSGRSASSRMIGAALRATRPPATTAGRRRDQHRAHGDRAEQGEPEPEDTAARARGRRYTPRRGLRACGPAGRRAPGSPRRAGQATWSRAELNACPLAATGASRAETRDGRGAAGDCHGSRPASDLRTTNGRARTGRRQPSVRRAPERAVRIETVCSGDRLGSGAPTRSRTAERHAPTRHVRRLGARAQPQPGRRRQRQRQPALGRRFGLGAGADRCRRRTASGVAASASRMTETAEVPTSVCRVGAGSAGAGGVDVAGRCRPRRQEGQRVEVAVRVGCRPRTHVHVRNGVLGRPRMRRSLPTRRPRRRELPATRRPSRGGRASPSNRRPFRS